MLLGLLVGNSSYRGNFTFFQKLKKIDYECVCLLKSGKFEFCRTV